MASKDRRRRRQQKRLQSRVAAFDREVLRFIVTPLIVWLVIATIVIKVSEHFPAWSGILGFVFKTASCAAPLTIFLGLGPFVRWAAARHDLLCQQCEQPLKRFRIQTRSREDPEDRCQDGELPSRCPYCHRSLEAAVHQTGGQV